MKDLYPCDLRQETVAPLAHLPNHRQTWNIVQLIDYDAFIRTGVHILVSTQFKWSVPTILPSVSLIWYQFPHCGVPSHFQVLLLFLRYIKTDPPVFSNSARFRCKFYRSGQI
jgi:hypothetical protein